MATANPNPELHYDYEEGAYFKYDEQNGDRIYLTPDGTPYKRVVRGPATVEQQATSAFQRQIRHRTYSDSTFAGAASTDGLSSQLGGLDLSRVRQESNYSHTSQGQYRYATRPEVEEEEEEEGDEYEDEEDQQDVVVDEGASIVPAEMTYGPKERITDPELLQQGATARGKISGTSGIAERLDPEFKIQDNPDSFFVPGRVIKILWPELAGLKVDNMTIVTAPNKKFKDEKVILKIRWFVVVKSGFRSCTCLPISTYGGRGLDGKNLPKKEHSIVYTGNKAPKELPGEKPKRRGERPMLSPIQVRSKSKQSKMDTKSRINYGKLYTIEHNVKVFNFGMVKTDDIRLLLTQWKDVLNDTTGGWEASATHNTSSYASTSVASTAPGASAHHYTNPASQSHQAQYIDHAMGAFDFSPNPEQIASGQISVRVDDLLGVFEYQAGAWARVYNARTQQIGSVPANYIRLDSSASSGPQYQA